jgi:hypothetical protein
VAHYLAGYPARFEREMGFTEADLLSVLPGALRGRAHELAPGQLRVPLDSGEMQLRWQVLPPRSIALMRMPRLAVQFDFGDTADAERQAVMKFFDLYTQRGGG